MYIDWLDASFKSKIVSFTNRLANAEDYSYFNYSLSGDLYNTHTKWGLGNLVFAVKLFYMLNELGEINITKKENLYKSIMRFADSSGYISDPLITQLGLKGKTKKILGLLDDSTIARIEDIKRAETRQAFAALCLLGRKPAKPFVRIPYGEIKIEKYLSSFDWHFPWDAGSHFSHLLFFLNMNSKMFSYKTEEGKCLIRYTVDYINRIQSKDDGCWYVGENIPLSQKINGAMKILTGLHVADIYEFPYAKMLADTALSATSDTEACSNFNIVYVLYACTKIIGDYRKSEIEDFLLKRLEIYKEYYYPNIGGFSFYKQRSNDNYYGKKITEGKNEPDIHGTVMFIWGITLISKMLNIKGIDFKAPIT